MLTLCQQGAVDLIPEEMSLSTSRWAPRTWRGPQSTAGPGPPRIPAGQVPGLELSKHIKLLRRLKWKSHLLVTSHNRVTQALQTPDPGPHDLGANEAETMFKLDFFEYYVLLERVLLHLLNVFNISVSPDVFRGSANVSAAPSRETSPNGAAIIGSSTFDRTYYGHRFHENVLQALDQPSNPLHTVLGTGDVKRFLGIAKESRNRWKDAEEMDLQAAVPGDGSLKHQRMLKEVDLEVMLACILEALDKAQGIAEEHVRNGGHRMNGTSGSAETREVMVEYNMDDVPMEAMPDAMEWEGF